MLLVHLQWIIFESATDLLSCLEAVGTDPDVVVVRVKNRLRADYDARQSAGYRDVMVNLRVATAETVRLGVDGHVCELQLVLRSFAELKVINVESFCDILLTPHAWRLSLCLTVTFFCNLVFPV